MWVEDRRPFGAAVVAGRQYLLFEPFIAESPQTMAIRKVRAMNQKVRSMLFWGFVGLLLCFCKRQLHHTLIFIDPCAIVLVSPRLVG